MKNLNIKNILLIGFDSNIGLGVVYCLRETGCNFYVLSHNKKNALKYSKAVKKINYYEDNKSDLVALIIEMARQYQIDFIMPYDEHEIRTVTANKELLSQYATCMWGTNPESFNIAINKRDLAAFLTQNDIPCPAFAPLEESEKVKSLLADFGFPVLLKAVRSSGGRKIQKVMDKAALDSFYSSHQNIGDYVMQPFIVGTDISCNVICKEGEVLCYTLQESPVKSGSNFSTNDILWFHEDEAALSIVKNMMKALNWHGVACVDMRRNVADNSIKVLEINGRFWASVVPSYLKAGVNFPLILLKLSMGETIDLPRLKEARQISINQYLRKKLTLQKVSLQETKYASYLPDLKARLMQIFLKVS